MLKEIYSINCFHISLIIIPPCCSKFTGSFFFNFEEQNTLFKDSIIFYCPTCKIPYPNVHKLFRNTVVLNICLASVNSALYENKKKGFNITVSTSASAYAILDNLINFESTFDFVSNQNIIGEKELFKEISRLIEIKFDRTTPKYLPEQGLKIGQLKVCCCKCNNSFTLEDSFIKNKNLLCPHCNNSQIVARKHFKDLRHFYKEFQDSIDLVNQNKIIVIPFSLTGAYVAYQEGDHNLFKILNKENY